MLNALNNVFDVPAAGVPTAHTSRAAHWAAEKAAAKHRTATATEAFVDRGST